MFREVGGGTMYGNMKLVIILFACFVRAESHKVCTTDWDYKGEKLNGPKDWSKTHPFCAGLLQSPITIHRTQISPPSSDSIIWFDNYYMHPAAGETYTLSNNGHTLIFEFPLDTQYYLKKGQNTFIPLQANIHFGSRFHKGSEHGLNGNYFQAEIHIVHRNTKYNSTKTLHYSDGLLVIGVFAKLKARARSSPVLSELAYYAQDLTRPGSSVKIPAFPLMAFLPCDSLKCTPYVNYQGSLTTPPCAESVDWVVLTSQAHPINLRDLQAIDKVLDCGKLPLYGNYRPTQATNGRHLYGVNM